MEDRMVELTSDDLRFISAFERVSGVLPLDYKKSIEGSLYFLVSRRDLGRAIGKNGRTIRELSKYFKTRVVIVPDSDDLETFIRGFFNNIRILDVEVREAMGDKAVFLVVDERDRGIAIGRNGERIKVAKDFLKSKFNATISIKTRRVDF